jgi:hypothetical protein
LESEYKAQHIKLEKTAKMFDVTFREEVREKIIAKAKGDTRIVSAAVIGSYASGKVDRWSDIDLTFGVRESFTPIQLVDSWTEYVISEFGGVVLFDAQRGNIIYRVFILPGCFQVDLSFSPASEFSPRGPHFNLLYGKQHEMQQAATPSNKELFGYMIHHILRAKICSERNRLWQAQFWINEARNYVLKLACLSRGLNPSEGRGFDDLPPDILNVFRDSFGGLGKEEISEAIKTIIVGIPVISEEVNKYSIELRDALTELSR